MDQEQVVRLQFTVAVVSVNETLSHGMRFGEKNISFTFSAKIYQAKLVPILIWTSLHIKLR